MSWMGSRPCLALVAAAMLATTPPSWSSQDASRPQSGSAQASNADQPSQNAPVLKVEVRVVLVDVVVTNKKGEPVTGLKKDQFTVLEDGTPENIASFEEHHDTPHISSPQATANSSAPLPPNTYTSSQTVQPSDSMNVLLLDWVNTQPADQVYVRTQVVKYLKTVPPGTRLAIFALTPELRIVQGFTTETARLLAAINDRKAGATTKSVGLLATQSRKAADQELIEMMTKADTAPVAIDAVRDFQSTTSNKETGDRSALTIAGLRELQSYLSAIPARKNVFWFAGEFPINSFPGAGPGGGPIINFSGALRQTADQFGPDRIAIYPISAAGRTEVAGFDPSQGLDRRAGATMSDQRADASSGPQQAAMETIAKETGGAAFYNTNALDREVTRAVEDAAHYYTLSYSPSNAARNGRFRTIQVKLAESNYRLSYRRGYYAESEAQRAAVASQGKEADPCWPDALRDAGLRPDRLSCARGARAKTASSRSNASRREPGFLRAGHPLWCGFHHSAARTKTAYCGGRPASQRRRTHARRLRKEWPASQPRHQHQRIQNPGETLRDQSKRRNSRPARNRSAQPRGLPPRRAL